MTAFAVQATGYHPTHGLLFTVALSHEGLAALLTGKALAFDLREQGLPKGHVVLVASADPAGAITLLGAGGFDALLGREPEAPGRRTFRCPMCGYSFAETSEDVDRVPRCPNDGVVLVEAA